MISYNPKNYLNYSELTEFLQSCEKAYPELFELESLGQTEEGREIWLATLTKKQTGLHSEKPAYWVDGNTHAIELAGTQACVHLIYQCLTQYESSSLFKTILDEQTLYVLPRISADGAEACLRSQSQSMRSTPFAWPYQDPMPGLYPKDLTQKGWIGTMRVENPFGVWRVSDKDSRLMVLRRPDEDENQTYYSLYTEGEVLNYDGHKILPQHKYGLDLNRNYPDNWLPEGINKGAGAHALSQKESRAVVNAIAKRPNIVGAQSFHTFSAVILRPFSYKSDTDMSHDDLLVYKALGKRGREITGYPDFSVFHDFRYHPKSFIGGNFVDWSYCQRGILSFTNEIWHLAKEAGVQVDDHVSWFFHQHKEEDSLQVLSWCDQNLEKDSFFQEWTAFDHPQLGAVEIGGWKSLFTWSNPPQNYLEKEVQKNVNFVLSCAQANPKVVIKETYDAIIEEHSKIRKISLTLVNKGYLPTYGTDRALTAGIVKKPRVKIKLSEDVELVQGDTDFEISHLTGRANLGSYQNMVFFALSHRAPANSNEIRLEWIVKGKGCVSVQVNFERAGLVRYRFD